MIKANELPLGNWLPIQNHPDYLISDAGQVYSIRRQRMLKVWERDNTYSRITLSVNGKEKSYTIHRLVATAFIPNPDCKRTVNHKDGNKRNNHVSNLEWATFSENQTHAILTGLAIVPHSGPGEENPSAKLSNVDVAMIRVLLQHDFTHEQIAKRFNIHAVHVSAIKTGKTWANNNNTSPAKN